MAPRSACRLLVMWMTIRTCLSCHRSVRRRCTVVRLMSSINRLRRTSHHRFKHQEPPALPVLHQISALEIILTPRMPKQDTSVPLTKKTEGCRTLSIGHHRPMFHRRISFNCPMTSLRIGHSTLDKEMLLIGWVISRRKLSSPRIRVL